jgi:hypothetical protein
MRQAPAINVIQLNNLINNAQREIDAEFKVKKEEPNGT